MSTPGWYPDPGGRSGHYRFWDGKTWAPTTTANPAGAAAGAAPAAPPPPAPRRRLGRWLVAAAVLVVVLAVVAAVVVHDANRPIIDYGPSPTATGGVETPAVPSVAPSVAPSSAAPSPRVMSPSPGATPSATPCPVGNPFARQDHRRDGRVHGGGLSFPQQPGWQEPGTLLSDFTWAYDVGETDTPVEPQWFTSFAVGAVSVADGFEDPQTAAELAMRCTVASALYSNVSSRTDLVDEQTTVDGYQAWTLRSEIRAYDARTSFGGDTVQITVVDLGSPEALAFFWGSAPLGDAALTARLDRVVQRLRVD